MENPSGGFVLFFTAGTYNKTNLRVEYATSKTLLGPYRRRGVLLKSGTYDHIKLSAAVGLDVVNTNPTEVTFESYGEDSRGTRIRQMYTAILEYDGTKVSLA